MKLGMYIRVHHEPISEAYLVKSLRSVLCVSVCIFLFSCRGNEYTCNNRRIVGRVVLYATRVTSKESRRLVLPKTSVFFIWSFCYNLVVILYFLSWLPCLGRRLIWFEFTVWLFSALPVAVHLLRLTCTGFCLRADVWEYVTHWPRNSRILRLWSPEGRRGGEHDRHRPFSLDFWTKSKWNKFWEELIAYFPLILHGTQRKRKQKNKVKGDTQTANWSHSLRN
jgi:hypothetical protein